MHAKIKALIYFMLPILTIAFVIMALSPLTSTTRTTPNPKTENSLTVPNKPIESSVAAASVWDGTNTAPSGEGTQTSPYIIDSAAKLAWLSANGANDIAYGKYYKQTVDIDLNNRSWTPINQGSPARTYFYDGGGYSISNLYINSTVSYTGLFGYITGGYIKNVHIVSGSVTSNKSNTGGIVGYSTSSFTITNCSNNAAVTSTSSYTGGIVGWFSSNCTIINCSNSGEVTGAGNLGGIVGICSSSTITNCSNSGAVTSTSGVVIGGIVGLCTGSTITNCSNSGAVTGTDIHIGGIAGQSVSTTIANCSNSGAVRSSTGYLGGIVGSPSYTTITNCVNYGDVLCSSSTATRVGGLVGYISGSARTPGSIENSFNTGKVQGGTAATTGGIAGEFSGATSVTKCYYDTWTVGNVRQPGGVYGTGSSPTTQSNVSGLTTTQMQGNPPSGMIGFITAYWGFAPGAYPHIIGMEGLALPVWGGFYPAVGLDFGDIGGTGVGSAADPYIIDSAHRLAWVSANSTNALAYGKYYRQTVDIDLNNMAWTPINNTNTTRTYYYDGNNFTIYNLYVNQAPVSATTNTYAGLFGRIGYDSYVKNLTINGGSVLGVHNGQNGHIYVGAFVAMGTGDLSNGPTYENLHNIDVSVAAILTHSGTTTRSTHVGGIAGENGYGMVLKCSSSGTITCTNTNDTGERAYVGGMIGWSRYCTISECKNYGVIIVLECKATAEIGGILGRGNQENIVMYCVNYGNIHVETQCPIANTHVGGIVGLAVSSSLITKSVNYGSVYANAEFHDVMVGGIIGYLGASNLNYCHNAGPLMGRDATTWREVGGIAGRIEGAGTKVEYCISTGCIANYLDYTPTLGGIVAWQRGASTIVSNCFYDRSMVASGPWSTPVYYLPTTVNQPIGVIDSGSAATDCAGLVTSVMQSPANGVAPSGMAAFTSDQWHLVANFYPTLRWMVSVELSIT